MFYGNCRLFATGWLFVDQMYTVTLTLWFTLIVFPSYFSFYLYIIYIFLYIYILYLLCTCYENWHNSYPAVDWPLWHSGWGRVSLRRKSKQNFLSKIWSKQKANTKFLSSAKTVFSHYWLSETRPRPVYSVVYE